MSAIYIARGHCENYYCGCGGGHLIAVAETEAAARELGEAADGKGTFYGVEVVGPFAVGELVPEDRR